MYTFWSLYKVFFKNTSRHNKV